MKITAEELSELDASLKLWIAVSEAKDLRIGELEEECHQLRRRVSRLTKMIQRQERIPCPQPLRSVR